MTNTLSQYKWVFMGTPQISVYFLEYLQEVHKIRPNLIVCNPDRKVGRKQIITAPPAKQFAQKHNIPVLQTYNLDAISEHLEGYDLFCVFAFGSLLKQHHLNLPKHGVLNIHPSLLPEYRGPSPITSAILDDQKSTGVSLMQLELGMDSGPVVAQRTAVVEEWSKYAEHEKQMAHIGADLFSENLESYIGKENKPEEQNHEQATYCKKYTKADMQIDLDASQYQQYRTYCAFEKPWFFSKKRYVITSAQFDAEANKFVILRVIPEGKNERDFLQDDINN